MLARNANEQDNLSGLLDPSRIAAVGLSLGGMTTQLATYHRSERDRRLAAAVSIAGPSEALERTFFQTADLPFLMIAGSSDAIVPYEANAAPIPDKVDNSLLVTLDRGSHTGFASVASTFMRWFDHPDALVCPLLLQGLEGEDGNRDEPMLEPDPAAGIGTSGTAPCTMESFDRAMRPGEQQMLTRLALFAFLESAFSDDAERRQAMDRYLTDGFTQENPSATVQAP
jgi:pimeloyl-ACP methyl ester carboxylesterase